VAMTDILISEQRIRRNGRHISQLDKDCYYLQLIHKGNVGVVQRGETHRSNAARGAIFSATEPYELLCQGEVRSFYLELPRDEFAQRFPRERVPVSALINTTQGLGRIATEFCASLAAEDAKLDDSVRAGLGNQLMDMLAFTMLTAEGDMPAAEGAVKKARLRSVQQWIEAHLRDPDLSLDKVATRNGMSLRYLHVLFEDCEMSASEWIWNRRLQLAYDCIARGDGRSITTIAFDNGFNSSAHFSTMFRRKYGIAPRDVIGR
jgi:AraC-like DNA-binding protein